MKKHLFLFIVMAGLMAMKVESKAPPDTKLSKIEYTAQLKTADFQAPELIALEVGFVETQNQIIFDEFTFRYAEKNVGYNYAETVFRWRNENIFRYSYYNIGLLNKPKAPIKKDYLLMPDTVFRL